MFWSLAILSEATSLWQLFALGLETIIECQLAEDI